MKVTDMKTTIVVVTHDQLDYLRLCLESIAEHTGGDYEVVVVDNASATETRDYLARWADQRAGCLVVANQANLGFAAACNQGLRAGTGECFAVLNDDMVVSHGWLTNLLGCLAATGAGLVGPMCNRISGAQYLEAAYESMAAMHRFCLEYNRPDPSLWKRTARLGGGALVIRRAVVERIGLFDERFTPGNYEDDDYCLRAALAGFSLYIAGDTFVHHFGGATLARDEEAYRRLMTRNGRLLAEKWDTDEPQCAYFRPGLVAAVQQGARRALDLRCGAGALGVELKNRGVTEVVGIEESRALCGVAARHLDLVVHGQPRVVELPYPDGYFDTILAADVLEHTADPWLVLRRACRWLARGGQLLAVAPNVAHIGTLVALLQGDWRYGDDGVLCRRHLRFFTRSSIAADAAAAGLEVVRVEEWPGEMNDASRGFLADLEQLANHYGVAGCATGREGRALELLLVAKKP
jgi:GT2 family glycosyltransferase